MSGVKSLLCMSGMSYQQIRYLFSNTGKWKKKITRTALSEVEAHWKDKVLSPTSTRISEEVTGHAHRDRKYILSMFPYPSGDLHMGHMRVYTVSDVLARYHRLNGSEVLHPIGWDAFGLPAENAAIEHNTAPRLWTESNISRMKEQLKDLRISFDWDKEIRTCSPEYYKWTQAIFLLMYKEGLAYSMKESVNWDPVDMTVLADEQIDSEGRSWRSGAKVTKKYLTQWYLRATNYTQSLLDGLDTLDPESCKGFANAQRDWLKQPTGVRINVKIEQYLDHPQPVNEILSVFTETPELLYGVDFLQISSTHPLLSALPESTADHSQKVRLLTDMVMINPLTNQKIPIVVKDGDQLSGSRNSRLGISILYYEDKETVSSLHLTPSPAVLDSQSRLRNSCMLNGLSREEARVQCNQYLQEKKLGGWPTSSELRDWLISRQRYWGTPIPIIHCTSCGIVPVPESDLPVTLPEVDRITREEGNPLQSNQEWIATPCPSCGATARRETDTMDTFVDSSWYFLRFTDPHNSSQPFSNSSANISMPVDVYVGGAEHAILHMYYARFFNHFLCDQDWTSHREPFTLQIPLGTVHSDCYKLTDTGRYIHRSKVKGTGENIKEKSTGLPVTHTIEKMSKSKLNGVNPNDVLTKHGVDQTRLYMLANENPRATKHWNPDLVNSLTFAHGKMLSIPRWIHKLWHTVGIIKSRRELLSPDQLIDMENDEETMQLIYKSRNSSVRAASLHLHSTFNLHEVLHTLYDDLHVIDVVPLDSKVLSPQFERCLADMLVLLHPFAPHVTAELWEGLRSALRLPSDTACQLDWDEDIFNQRWPQIDDEYLVGLKIIGAQSDTVQSEEECSNIDQSNSTEEESTKQTHRLFIKLPAKVFKTMTLANAINVARDHGMIDLRDGGHSHPDTNTNCNLNIIPNAGAVLTVSGDWKIIHKSSRESKLEMTSSE